MVLRIEYERLKPLPVRWIPVKAFCAHRKRTNTYNVFTDRGDRLPSDIPTYEINVFDVSLIGKEIQTHVAVVN